MNVEISFSDQQMEDLKETITNTVLERISAQPPAKEPKENLMDEHALMQFTGFKRTKLWRDRKAGKLTFLRLGNELRYREQDVEQYLKRYNPRLA
jgi:predicted DNA-binding transcriptional regulator AlpA